MARSNFDVTSLASGIITDLASMTQLMIPQTCKLIMLLNSSHVGHWYLCFGLQVMPASRFKATLIFLQHCAQLIKHKDHQIYLSATPASLQKRST